MTDAMKAVERRRREQDRQHGGANHDDRHTTGEWITLLAKFLGRVGDAAPVLHNNPRLYREALTDLAAVAIAAAESFDRKGGF